DSEGGKRRGRGSTAGPGSSRRRPDVVRRAREADVRSAGAGDAGRRHACDHVPARAGNEHAHVSRDRRGGSASPADAPRQQSGKDRAHGEDQRVPCVALRVLPREAEVDARRRRHAAGSLDGPLRQRHGQPERPRSREPADHRRRRRRGPDEGRTAHQLRGTDAAGEPAPDAAREGRRAPRQVCRQPGKGRRAARSLTHGADIMMGSTSFGLSAAALLLSAVNLSAASADAPVADAMEKMDRAAVRALLQRKADINAPQVDGMTALHWAAYQDDLESVELLVRAGANAKAANRYGITPLTLAITNGNSAMVEGLLKAGADPNTTLPGGETALMTAARVGTLASVKALVACGATVDSKDEKHGQTALMWAAAEGHAPVVEMLIEVGADFKARLASGMTPLLFASREGHSDVVRALLKAGVDVNEPVPVEGGRRRAVGGRALPPGATPLLTAVMNAHFELAAQLLDAGANPNANLPGYTVLHAIVPVRKPGVGDNDPAPEGSGSMSSLELVRKLVAAGADVNARMTRRANLCNTRLNEVGATPFMMAALTA